MSNQQPDAPGQDPTPQGGFPQPGAYTPPQTSSSPANPAAPYPGQYTPPAQAYPSGYPQQPQAYPQQPQAYLQQPSQGYQQPQYAPPPGAYQTPGYGTQPPYAGQQYPAQQSYPASTWQPEAKPAAKSPILGIIAFVAIILTIAVGAVSLFQIMAPLMNAIVAAGPDAANDPSFRSSLQAQITTAYPVQAMLLSVCSPVGLAAWVVGWVAAIGRRGRLWGVLAIVLGVLAIPILLIVMFAAMGPALEAVR